MPGWNASKVEAFKDSYMEFSRHVKINSKETGGDTVLGDSRYESQHRFLNTIFDGLTEDIHDFKFLKSRQLGLTTESRSLSIFWLGIHKGLPGAMVFDTLNHREEARNEIMTMIRDLPGKLRFPTITKDSRDMLVLSNGSTLRFLNAGVQRKRASGTLGRSSGLSFAHVSECCSFENEEGIMSFRNSLAENNPDRLQIWESTARGFNQWYRIWQEAKSDNLNQRTCFIGWWAKDSQRIERGTAMFERYGTKPPNEDELERMTQVKQLYNWEITQEQLAWYRRKSKPSPDENDSATNSPNTDLILQEQSWTEMESFLQTGSTFFPGDKLTDITKTTATDKYDGYRFYHGTEFMNSDWKPHEGKKYVELKVWQEPDQDGEYIIAADPAYGHSEENNHSSVQVLRGYADCLEQVAEYANSSITTQPFAWVIATLAGWYKNSTLILEINGPGESVWNEYKSLKQQVLSGHLKDQATERGLRDIFVNVRDYMYARSDAMTGAGSCFHFKTTTQLKVAIMERLRDFVSNKTLIIRSFDELEEMKSITRKGDTIGAEGQNRDDRTICLGMGIKAWEQAVRRKMSVAGRTREHEIANKRMTIKDQIGLFNKHSLDAFLKGNSDTRRKHAAVLRRQSWRRGGR